MDLYSVKVKLAPVCQPAPVQILCHSISKREQFDIASYVADVEPAT